MTTDEDPISSPRQPDERVDSSATSESDVDNNNNNNNNNAQEEINKQQHQHSTTTTNNSTTTSLLPRRSLDEEKIDKAEAFLRNTEIQNVSTLEKRNYLETKVGMTSDEIDVALERAADDARGGNGKERIMANNSKDGDRKRNSSSSLRQREEDNIVGRDDQFRDSSRSSNHQRYQEDYDSYANINPRQRRGGPIMPERRRPPPPHQQQYPQPTHDYNNNNNMHQGPSSGREEIMTPSSSSSFIPALAGGFSLGVFCLAAVRWLNGGDFVLLPPPTATTASLEYTRATMEKTSYKEDDPRLLAGDEEEDEEDADESDDSQQQEDGEFQEEENVEYEETNESESNEVEDDDVLNKILNGTTANAQPLHQQPSYDELVLEIRGLTSAIHSYRDVQERANRAVHAHVGKGMTDDAMDFLRQKKSSDVDTLQQTDDGANVVVSTISLLLKEVSEDMLQLKQSILQVERDGEDESEPTGDSDSAGEQPEKESDIDEKEDGEEPTKQIIEKVMEKIKKMLTVIDNERVESNNEKERSADSDEKYINGASTAVESESKSGDQTDESPADAMVSSAHSDQTTDEKSQQSEKNPHQQQPSNVETSQQTNNEHELEEALKTLSNNNTPDELKVGAQMLYLYCLNISKYPSTPRYRKIYTNNNTFKNKVGNLKGAKEFLRAVGFVERANFFEWDDNQTTTASAADNDYGVNNTKSKLDFALVALEMLKNGVSTNNKPSSSIEDEDDDAPASLLLSESTQEEIVVASSELPSISAAALSVPTGMLGKGIELN